MCDIILLENLLFDNDIIVYVTVLNGKRPKIVRKTKSKKEKTVSI